MADGATSEHGDNAVLSVEVEHKNAREPAPIPLRQVVEHNVQDPAKKHRRVTLIHALVGRTVICIDNNYMISDLFCFKAD